MRSRLLAVLLPISVLVGVLLPTTVAFAAPGGAAVTADDAAVAYDVVLATEAGNGEAPGPDPQDPNSEENPGRPKDYTRPPIWWGAVLFVAAGAAMLLGVAAGYYLLVVRAGQKAEAAKAAKK